MSAAQRENLSTGSILQFPIPPHQDTWTSPVVSAVVEEVLVSPEFGERLRSEVEDAISEVYLWTLLSQPTRTDDPFDAIYLSELLPDQISAGDVQLIQAYANVEDLSDELEFDDGWDD